MTRSKRPRRVCAWITGRVEQGVQPHEIGIFARSTRKLRAARNVVKQAGVQAIELSDKIEITPGKVSIGTMHLAKGLEFPPSRSWRATMR
jgi:superfamily I DNA/RNA helicase